MSQPRPNTPFTPADLDETVQYKAVSAMAVVALAAGLASPLALLGRPLWSIPVAGVVLAVLGLRRIGKSEGALAGRKVALLGLALSLLFGSAATSWSLTHDYLLGREARAFAERWIGQLASGEFFIAHQLCQPYEVRRPLDSNLFAHYRQDEQAQESFDRFLAQPAIRTLQSTGRNGKLSFGGTRGIYRDGPFDLVRQAFQVRFYHRYGRETFTVQLVLERSVDVGGTARWRVYDYAQE